jgi:multimeric flavodoxin WrbA
VSEGAGRTLVALNGSPLRGSSVDRLLEALCAGAVEAGGSARHIRCAELNVKPCQACGPEPTDGYCIYHDDMDPVFAALEACDRGRCRSF